jgi:hypothetical protein
MTLSLSVDASSKRSGWAMFREGKLLESGSLYPEKHVRQIYDLCNATANVAGKLYLEAPLVKGVRKSLQSAATQGGGIYLWRCCFLSAGGHKNNLVMVPPHEWRKRVYPRKKGRGTTDYKAMSIEFVRMHFGIKTTDHDHAEAVIIGHAMNLTPAFQKT